MNCIFSTALVISCYLVFPRGSNAITYCQNYTSCSTCIGNQNCAWCSSSCLDVSEASNCDTSTIGGQNSCTDSNYVLVVFIIVISALLFLCCATCYWRTYQDHEDGLLGPLLPTNTRNMIWRNSLQETGSINIIDAHVIFVGEFYFCSSILT